MHNATDVKCDLDQKFIFNVLDWHEFDEVDINKESDKDSDHDKSDQYKKYNKYNDNKRYVIKAFGRTLDDKSVYLRIEKFPPHFYILLPETWTTNLEAKCEYLVGVLKNKNSILEHTLEKFEIVKRKKLYGFYAGKKFNFLRLVFTNRKSIYDAVRIFDNKIQLYYGSNNGVGIQERLFKFDVYESNIDPYIRFMHIQNLISCGWLSIDKKLLRKSHEPNTCDISYSVDWCDVLPFNSPKIAPFYMCSFDIECKSDDGSFPQANRQTDAIIQIGMTFTKYGSMDIVKRIMISFNTCDPIENAEVYSCKTEQDLLLKFQEIIKREDPDILTGYNIFSFDLPYIIERAKLLNVDERFYHLSKINDHVCKLLSKKLSSSALGENNLNYIDSLGRVNIDLMKVVQRDEKLSSYKLDSVAENFFKDKVTELIPLENGQYKVISDRIRKDKNGKEFVEIDKTMGKKIENKNLGVLKEKNYVRFEKDGEIVMLKFRIIEINYSENWFIIEKLDPILTGKCKLVWGLVKDDIKPKQIFECYKKTSADRRIIAEYCIQDCALVSKLMTKLEVLTNNISMASVCHVPLHYIFFRGQGIKSLSLVAKYCRNEGYLIPIPAKITEDSEDVGYEGATVLDPDIKFHQTPIPVMDYNSLYPSSMISSNISHETLVTLPEYDNLPSYVYNNVTYNNSDGSQTTCRFAKIKDQFIDSDPSKSKKGVIPSILQNLAAERKAAKKAMAKAFEEGDFFKEKIFNGLQLALKVTMNSIYGQLGARTSPICDKRLAASTTAIGRRMLLIGQAFVENDLKNILTLLYDASKKNDDVEYERLMSMYLKERDPKFEPHFKKFIIALLDNFNINPKCIYGDTDSIFINMDASHKISNKPVIGNEIIIEDKNVNIDELKKDLGNSMIEISIELGHIASRFLKTTLPYPHNMEYEKTFFPLALMAKKKYIGNKYDDEHGIDHPYQSAMGVVLKRRDNANIVKKIIGGMVNIMMNKVDVDMTIRFIKKAINDLLKGKFEIHEFITSKTLKSNYVDRTRLAHVVLADRMALRDPGNAPQLNERIPYVAVEVVEKKGQKMLQGEKIEHPDYIAEHKLKIDYLFYLKNQIMNPSIQFLELLMTPAEAEKLFDDFINAVEDKRKGVQSLMKFGITKSQDTNSVDIDFDNLINKSAKPNKTVKSKKAMEIKKIDEDKDLEEFYERTPVILEDENVENQVKTIVPVVHEIEHVDDE
jgi:DNA polymerase elongation subunit (family B)